MNRKFSLLIFVLLAVNSAFGFDLNQDDASIALVYRGPGACEDGCAEAAFEMATLAGLKAVYVGPNDLDQSQTAQATERLFASAKVWIQPGGVSNEAYYTMTAKMRSALYQFIKNGGGYVGFCAGAFMATSGIGGTGDPGLAVIPGGTGLFRAYAENPNVVFSLQNVTWKSPSGEMRKRKVYFEGGPYLWGIENNPKVEIMARYFTGHVASARTVFGKGRVYVTGLHPEAPAIWSEEDNVHDPDGVDHDLAIEMIFWAVYGFDLQPSL